MKVNISSKSQRIELSNATFTERKSYQVFTDESETFHRRRRNGKSNCKNGAQKTQNLPFPLHDVDSHLIQQCLGQPNAPPQTAAPTFTHFATGTPQSPHWLQWGAPYSFQKLPLPVDRSPNPKCVNRRSGLGSVSYTHLTLPTNREV